MLLSLRPMRTGLALVVLLLSACSTPSRVASPAYASVEATGGGAVAERARAGDPGGVTGERQVVRTAQLWLTLARGADRAALARDAQGIVDGAGGYVASESAEVLTLRVPDARLEDTLDRLSALARDAERSVQTVDVTEAAVNLDIRLANARALQERLRGLLAQTATVADAIAVERELARVTTEVEQLEAQMRSLQDRVALSTVTVRLRERVRPGPLGWVVVGAYRVVEWLFVWR